MNRHIFLLILIIVMGLVISACGGDPLPAPTEEVSAAAVNPTAIVVSDTATPVPTDTPPEPTATSMPTNTPTPEPPATAVPTDTPTPLPTDTATLVPTDTPTPEPTATSMPTDTPTPEPTATPAVTPTRCPIPTAPEFVASYAEMQREYGWGCPEREAVTTNAAGQAFEKGAMLWHEGTIYVFDYSQGDEEFSARVYIYEDTWEESQPSNDPTLTPPPGLFQPIRGFGKVWRTQLGGPEAKIGWGVEEERGYQTTFQYFDGGIMIIDPRGQIQILIYVDE